MKKREFITMYQIDYTNVGKRMKTPRKQAGYTQEQIADALDVTVAFISNIENDRVKNEPSCTILLRKTSECIY